MSEQRLKITYLNAITSYDSPVIAIFGFQIPSMDFYGSKCKLIRKKDGTVYIAFPSEKYVDPKTGRDEFGNFFWFGKKSSDFFQKQALEAIRSWCATKGLPDLTEIKEAQNTSVFQPTESYDPFSTPRPTDSTLKILDDLLPF